jgi:DNA-binding CsgD family transcriptional regulator
VRRDDVLRVDREVSRLAHSGLDWSTLSLRAGEAVRRAVPFDHACWHTVDPGSMLFTGVTKDSLEDEVRLPYHEYALADVNQWADLARRPLPVGVLSDATAGQPGRSPRYRELLRPRGIGAEVRVAFVAAGTCWGACGIYRDRGRADFSSDEARLLGRVGQHLADGYRRALLLAAAGAGPAGTPPPPAPTPASAAPQTWLDAAGTGVAGSAPARSGPGLVLLDTRGEVESADEAAVAYLGTVDSGWAGEVPAVVRAVAERARRADPGQPARARVRTRDGGWLVLHGTRMPAGPAERLAVLIEPAGPPDLWPMIADAYRLSRREREITLLCLRGLSTAEMARTLHLSPYTLQDQLKVIFDKVGVRARRALVAKVFLDCYWQPIAGGRTPGHRGGFPTG